MGLKVDHVFFEKDFKKIKKPRNQKDSGANSSDKFII
jgi:hypothetical protein